MKIPVLSTRMPSEMVIKHCIWHFYLTTILSSFITPYQLQHFVFCWLIFRVKNLISI